MIYNRALDACFKKIKIKLPGNEAGGRPNFPNLTLIIFFFIFTHGLYTENFSVLRYINRKKKKKIDARYNWPVKAKIEWLTDLNPSTPFSFPSLVYIGKNRIGAVREQSRFGAHLVSRPGR